MIRISITSDLLFNLSGDQYYDFSYTPQSSLSGFLAMQNGNGRIILMTSNTTQKLALGTDKVSISPTFYKQLSHTKVFCAAFMFLRLGFVIYWKKEIGEKPARKMLLKLSQGSNNGCSYPK